MSDVDNQPFREGDLAVLYDRRSREYMAELKM